MKATLSSLHHQALDWTRELEFYAEELKILSNRLGEVSRKNNGQETMTMVEHFQNKFIMLKEQIDILKHETKKREEHIEKTAIGKPSHINEQIKIGSDKIFDQMIDLSKSIATTRYEFNHFLSKVM